MSDLPTTTQDLPDVESIRLTPLQEAVANANAEADACKAKAEEAKAEEAEVEETSPTACDVCGKDGENNKRCGACFGPYYCSNECHAKGWKMGHSKRCKIRGLPIPFLYAGRPVQRVFADSLAKEGIPADTLLVCPPDTVIENVFNQKVDMTPCWFDTFDRCVVASAKLEQMMLVLKPWHSPRLTDENVRTVVWVMENKKLADLYEFQISGSELVAELKRFTNVDYIRLLKNVTSFKDTKLNRSLFFIYQKLLQQFAGDEIKFMMTWAEEGVHESVCVQNNKPVVAPAATPADSPPLVTGRRKMLALFKEEKYAEALEVASLIDRNELPAMLRGELLRSEAACHHRLKDFGSATKKAIAAVKEYELVFNSTDSPTAETYRMLGVITKDALEGTFTTM